MAKTSLLSEKVEGSAIYELGKQDIEEYRDQTSKAVVAARLREAVREGGGNKHVAARSGVPLGSLSNYLAGNYELKVPVLVALARACNVSLDWLAEGRGSRQSEWIEPGVSGPPVGSDVPGGGQVVQGPIQPLDVARHDPRRTMFTEENVSELTEALDEAERLIEERGSDPETRGRVQLMLLLRDHTYRGRHGG